MSTIDSLASLEKRLKLTGDEASFVEQGHLPVRISDSYFALIDPKDPRDPIRRQVVPTIHEYQSRTWEDIDPLEEVAHSVSDRLIHRYKSTAAFLTTDYCFTYCRHCFRRRFTGTFQGPATRSDIEEAAGYLKKHNEVKEVLLTGGDLLTLSDEKLDEMVTILRTARQDLVLRICTRAPVTYPERVTDALVETFARHKSAPFYLMVQFNHPRELTPASINAVAKFVDHGIPAMNQSVLLRGVNDNVDVLEELCNKLVAHRIKPYYLFQGDLVEGTDYFRVPLEKGLEIEAELRKRLSGLAMPAYTSDLPHGGGKIPLCQHYLIGHEADGTWTFRTPGGEIRHYHDPKAAD